MELQVGHPSSSRGVQVLCWGKVGKAAQVLRPPGCPQEDDYDSILRVSTAPDPAAPCGTHLWGVSFGGMLWLPGSIQHDVVSCGLELRWLAKTLKRNGLRVSSNPKL